MRKALVIGAVVLAVIGIAIVGALHYCGGPEELAR